MPRYYLDVMDDRGLLVDDEGVEFRDPDAVQEEAARSLAEMARDAARTTKGGPIQRMAIEVRDDTGPVMNVRFVFEIDRKK